MYLLLDNPEVYGLPVDPKIPLSLTLWKDVVRPAGGLVVGGAAAAVLVGVFANFLRGNYKATEDDSTNHADSKKGGKK